MSVQLRPEVAAFAQAMERKLRTHDVDRGSSWKTEPDDFFIYRMFDELAECRAALDEEDPVIRLRRMGQEAVDIGNFAMMLFFCCEET